MGCCSRAWFALMRRNLVYRKRHWIATILEFILPVLFVWFLLLIKNLVKDTGGFESAVVEPTFPSESYQPLSFADYVTALQAQRVCVPTAGSSREYEYDISGMERHGYNWQVPLVKCDSRMCDFEGQNATDFCEYGMIALSGADENDSGGKRRANDFLAYLQETYPAITTLDLKHDLVQMFDSPAAMDAYVRSTGYGGTGENAKITMGIVFEGNSPEMFSYQLRQNSTNFNTIEEEARPASQTTPPTSKNTDSFTRNDFSTCILIGGAPFLGPLQSSCTGQYIYNGVLTIQRLVGDFIISESGAKDVGYHVAEAAVQFASFPTREYTEDGFFGAIEDLAAILVVLGLLYPVASMISYITKEKEFRQKELMKMMSVSESDIGWSWFATFMIFNIFTATATTFVSSSLYATSETLLLWFFWVFTFMSMVVFSMAMAAITSKSTRAVLIGLLFFFLGVFLTLAVDYQDGEVGAVGLISLHPAAAFAYGLKQIGRLEENGVGLTTDSVSFSDNPSGYSFSNTLSNLIFDSILWGILSWYLNRVIKPDYGQAYPIWFPFTKSYWCSSQKHSDVSSTTVAEKLSGSEIPYEPVGEALGRQANEGKSIEIHNLRKDFGDKSAVDGLNLSMYQGQITALLGHNGAGKTTTINMLTGAMAPTSGYATVAGRDIRTDLRAIRQDIGICLQHDCLFPNLTVREHMQFFSRLKGLYSKVSKEEAENQIDDAIRDVALFEKRNTLSKSLSGGMKRKLSVAMAFCGGSEVVLLDEPTSGMDPFSRRFTWNVIRQYRQNRCIILTTHFMDEADILGDRIAIMAEGQLRCAGSGLFLKKTYGVGYQLTIEKSQGNDNMEKPKKEQPDTENSANPEKQDVKQLVEDTVPEANLLSDVGTEVKYQIPLASASKFATMFEGLDSEVTQKNIVSYGVSVTTLDEVFLLVARGGSPDEQKRLPSSRINKNDALHDEENADRSARSRMNLEKTGLLTRHIGALFKKRAANFKRDRKAWICTTIVPVLFVLIGLLVARFASPDRDLDAITLDLSALNQGFAGSSSNPIPVNNPGNPYQCQPGVCAYQSPFVVVDTGDENESEVYSFCGAQANLGFDTNMEFTKPPQQCTLAETFDIVNALNDFEGAFAVGTDGVNDVRSSAESLYNSSFSYPSTQYGAIWFTREPDSTINGTNSSFGDSIVAQCEASVEIGSLSYTSADECEKFRGLGYVVQYNFTGIHSAPLYQALADQALVRYATNNPDFTIKTTIAPLPITKIESGFGTAEDVTFLWFLTMLAFPFIAGAFATFIVSERQSKAKHLQTVAGVEPAAYWISTFLWDCVNYLLPVALVVALLFIFKVDALTTSDRDVFSGILTLMLCFGPAAAGFAYCLTFAFTSPSLCNIFIIISGFLVGMGGPLATFILDLLSLDNPIDPNTKLSNIANIVTWVLRPIPSFCFGKGLFYAINIETFAFIEGDVDISAWSNSVLLIEIYCLIAEAIIYTGLAILLDIWSSNPSVMAVWGAFVNVVTFRWLFSGSQGPDITTALPEDDDVLAEQERVLSGGANDDMVVISQMKKVYGNRKIAVNNMSLGIHPGECFGLLGINGAGKTTTMGMLTAEFPPTSGDATLAGFSVTKEPQKIRRRIGYCPQFDAHFANMTGREHVELYGSIKGIPKKFVKEAAATKLKEVGLSDYDSDRPCVNYSGGMKRRLSLACAMIGQPQIVFLDECSTGVDPVARREIWELISGMVAGTKNPNEEKTSVILTTHSMEECEALCPRIAIMANGRMRCLGSAQHLKSKFGQGFQLELKVKLAENQDEDMTINASNLASRKTGLADEDALTAETGLFFDLQEAKSALENLTGDTFLSDQIVQDNPVGYVIWKDAESLSGVSLLALATFATGELRMRKVADFVQSNFPNHVLRERQDTKARYEVGAENTRISTLFSKIEAAKEELRLADYGVSQTSLEQVFNVHAEEAEKLKQGRNDR